MWGGPRGPFGERPGSGIGKGLPYREVWLGFDEFSKIIQDCEGAEFDRNLFSIVARGLRGRESRKRYEAIWIRHFDRSSKALNVCESSRELKLF